VVFYGIFGVVLVAGGLALEEPMFRLFHISGVSPIYRLILLSCGISNMASMFLSVFKGIQRMDASNAIEVKLSLVNAAGTLILLESGWGMFGLAVNSLVQACFSLIVTWWAVRRMLPMVSLKWHFDKALLREMFAYGVKIQVSRIGDFVRLQADKLIISRFLGIAAVSFYEVSARLTSFMRAVPLVMLSALIPATSELGARKERTKILQTYLLASKYVTMITVALVVFLVLEARSVLNLWLGNGFEDSVVLVQILAIGYGVNVLGGAASQTGAGVGRPEFDMRSTILLAILNPILSVILVRQFGAPGAAGGTSIALVIAAAYLLAAFHRNYVQDSVWTMLQDVYLRPVAAGIFANLLVLGVHRLFPDIVALEHVRSLAIVKIAADFAVFVPAYIFLLVAFRQVTALDWNNFLSLMSFGFEFLRNPSRERVKIYR
jgi:O-antigen/teichoic acid export membrane protein